MNQLARSERREPSTARLAGVVFAISALDRGDGYMGRRFLRNDAPVGRVRAHDANAGAPGKYPPTSGGVNPESIQNSCVEV
jgi:hypothetical protein